MSRFAFGQFELDLIAGELLRDGVPVKLQPVLARLLIELTARPGELVTREELAGRLWPAGTFVDWENSLNNAVARLRRAIGPSWIETLPKRGYRFRARKPREPSRQRPEADRAWRLGRYFWARTTVAGLERSIACYRQALAEHPEHAPAHAGLADSFILLGDDVVGGMAPAEALRQAESAALRAMELAPDNPQALAALGMVTWRLRWDWNEAERLFRTAIAMRRDYPIAHVYYSWLLLGLNRQQQAESEIRKAYELDSISPFIAANVGIQLYLSRRYSDAVAHLRDALTLDEYYPLARLPFGMSLLQLGRSDEATASLARGSMLAGDGASYYRAVLGHALAASNCVDQARRIQADSGAFDRALVHLGFGERGAAIDCLEEAAIQGSSHVAYVGIDPLFDPLRRERRFQRLARSIGLL